MLVRCGDHLAAQGFEIRGVASRDAVVRSWAESHGRMSPPLTPPEGTKFLAPGADLTSRHFPRRFDYLFSIVNHDVLPQETLDRADVAAINFHDSLLPRYAGVHATSWAILNGENKHGISWHLMSARVDAGPIVASKSVRIEDRETALSLNLKCHAAAFEAFTELVEDLLGQGLVARDQDPAERTYFGKFDRLPGGCVMDFDRDAEDLDVLVRALDFGPSPNRLGVAKLAVGTEFFIVKKLRPAPDASPARPGTILGIDGGILRVATRTRDVEILEVATLDGAPLGLDGLVSRQTLRPGDVLLRLGAARAERLTHLDKTLARYEEEWVRRLSSPRRLELPFAARERSAGSAGVRLPALAVRDGFSDSDYVLAAWAAFLARVSGRRRFDLGFRSRAVSELEDFGELFSKVVPFRVRFSGDESFTEAVAMVRAEKERLRRWLSYGRDVWARYPILGRHGEEGIWPVAVVEAGADDNPEDVSRRGGLWTLVLRADGESDWIFDPSIASPETAGRRRRAYEAFAAALERSPARSIFEQPIFGPVERQQLLYEWNDTARPYPRDADLAELFARQAALTPTAVALEAPAGVELTYAELDRQAEALARALSARGVVSEARLGLCLRRGPRFVVALVGVLKAGGVYVPLDPDSPHDRLAFMARDADLSLLLTEEAWHDRLRSIADGRFEVVPLASLVGDAAGRDRRPCPRADHLAYIMYTSGSTGRPKGIGIPHRAVARLVLGSHFAKLGPGESFLQLAPVAFDASTLEIWGSLLHGGRLVFPPEETPSPAELGRLLRRHRITSLWLTAGLFHLMAEERPADLAGLGQLLAGGDVLDPRLVRRVLKKGPVVVNGYGPTESTTFACCHPMTSAARTGGSVSIGRPIANTRVYVMSPRLEPVPSSFAGELCIAGDGLARSYWRQPARTARSFVPDPLAREPGGRLYRTGDRAAYLPDGRLNFLGRLDHQLKIRGFRVEPGEIEAVLGRHSAVETTAVVARRDPSGERALAAFVVRRPGMGAAGFTAELRGFLRAQLPEPMVPAAIELLDALPLTPNGKVDRIALARRDIDKVGAPTPAAEDGHEMERAVAAIWSEVLGQPRFGLEESFFDVGGSSLLLFRVHERLRRRLGVDLPITALFEYPTIRTLGRHLSDRVGADDPAPAPQRRTGRGHERPGIAIIGLAGRFPGGGVEELWENLCAGNELISFFSEEELARAGVAEALRRDPRYVGARAVLEDIELFDAELFAMSPREAERTDPQHRLFLECAWEALADAGYDPRRYDGAIGLYAGAGLSGYALDTLAADPGDLQAQIAGDKDYLTTRVSYKLGLRGPSLTVQTACSTSLVAVHLARQALWCGECDLALAGGVSVLVPQTAGYLYTEEGILSPDGHCRAFDIGARGTVLGNGAGIVVLKRLDDALADGDPIRAVIRGTAVNNDGAAKAGYTAPSVAGQAAVIRAAHAAAGVEAASLSYIEAHGTGTALGDAIEITALRRVFGDGAGTLALGSIKTNIGHLGAAAGVAGLIKTVLALERRQLPPSLHFTEPHPDTGLAASRFQVHGELRSWPRTDVPRRAGVSSFGIGGTNAHAVVEEAPAVPAPTNSRPCQLLLLSARSEAALETASTELARCLESTEPPLADVAYTLQVGRPAFAWRRVLVSAKREEATAALVAAEGLPRRHRDAEEPAVAFLFPGQGTQHVDMGRELYEHESTFRSQVDRCCELLVPHLGRDLRTLLYPPPAERQAAAAELDRTVFTQPALFVVSYALAKLFMEWGVRPRAFLGHSIGEWVAACLAGVFDLADALTLVALRGRLIQDAVEPGAMLAVSLPADELQPLPGGLFVAAVNAPARSVVSGSAAAIDALAAELADRDVAHRRLRTTRAFHSAAMDGILATFAARVAEVPLMPPALPFVSNVTGDWITREDATDPDYWARHLRHPVHFSAGLARLLEKTTHLLEIGPGATLTGFARRHPAVRADNLLLSLADPRESGTAYECVLTALGSLWLAGFEVDWDGFYAHEGRRRVALPPPPFERRPYWRPDAVAAAKHRPDEPAAPDDALYGRPAVLGDSHDEPADDWERVLCGLWQGFLGIENVGRKDSFFQLGGDSLLATQILAQLRRRHGVEATLRQFFQNPTLEKFATMTRPVSGHDGGIMADEAFDEGEV